ncbi:---NA--- [Octopus vulgaris]|uniref:---NA n=1 Tax=Octopus vulgaris TaxID=6645 RepID=A0AA36AKZ6_OCTVU|nr:---NA--- [Octopus vulgaris]
MTFVPKNTMGVPQRKSANEIDHALYDLFQCIRLRNVPINGLILKHKANTIAQAAGLNFKAFKYRFLLLTKEIWDLFYGSKSVLELDIGESFTVMLIS